jgi:hypothetical protein
VTPRRASSHASVNPVGPAPTINTAGELGTGGGSFVPIVLVMPGLASLD